jgi:tape measure domain-containing protein
MANLVEFIVKIRDMGSGSMMQLAKNSDGAFNRMGRNVKTFGRSIDQLEAKIDALTKTRDISINTRQIRAANAEIEALERKRDKLQNAGRSNSMGGLTGGMVMGGLLGGAALGSSFIKQGMDRQLAGTAFEVMAGKKDGDKLHKDLIGFATDTIYGNEVFGEAKEMLGFGVAAKNIMPSMKMLGDIAFGDKEHMKSLTLGFSEAAAAGRLTGREMLIMTDAGFNPLQAISAKTGRSMADLKKEVEKGKISFQDLAGAMEYATGKNGRYYNGMQRIGETPTGKIIAFGGAMETLAGTIGMKLLPTLGKVVDFFTRVTGDESTMYSMAGAIGAMGLAWLAYTGYVNGAAIATGALEVLAYWPLAAVGVLGAAFADLQQFNVDFGKTSEATAEKAAGTFGHTFTVFEKLKWSFQDLFYYLEEAMLRFEVLYEKIDNFQAAGKKGNLWDAIKSIGNETDGSRKIQAMQLKHKWDVIDRESGGPVYGGKKPAADYMTSKFDITGAPPAGAEDTNKGITGGGVRNFTINIAKQGIDQITIHAATVTEGKEQIKNMFIEMFDQIVNSGGAVIANN